MSVEILEKLHGSVEEFKSTVLSRVEALEALEDRPKAGGGDDGLSREQKEHTKTFIEWIRKPVDPVYGSRLKECEHELQRKDVTVTGTGAAGGYALPEEISRAIEVRERQLNPFRELVRVDTCSTNDYKALVTVGNGTTGWVDETSARSATATSELRERAPTFGEQYAYPTVSEWSLDDIFFNVQQWLVNEVSADWAAQEATAIISGDGTAKPTGILNTTPTTADDNASPERAHGVIEYVGLDSASSPTVATISIDSLITLVSTVRERYLMESDKIAFAMHRLTLAALRKQKAVDSGNYVWGDAASGNPPTLLGYRVVTCDAMPTIANDNFAVLFGNWARGYLLVDRVGIRVLLNPYSVPGKVSFYVRRRLGGCVLNNDAVKALRISD